MSKFIGTYKSFSSRIIKILYPQIRKNLWKEYFWNGSYYLLTAGVAPLEIINKYIENQSN
jgi:putative transposase